MLEKICRAHPEYLSYERISTPFLEATKYDNWQDFIQLQIWIPTIRRQTNKGTCRPNNHQRHPIKSDRRFRLSTYRVALRSRTNMNQQLINRSGRGGRIT
jgi:hypothetical protein